MDRLIGIIGRIGALALLLAVMAFALPGQAEAAPMNHAHHAADVAHGHDMAGHQCDECDEQAPADHAAHMGHGCHCVSAACTPVMPPQAASVATRAPADVLSPWPVSDAEALASVDPPSEPPRT